MFCTNCGGKLVLDSFKFCPNCGAKVVELPDTLQQAPLSEEYIIPPDLAVGYWSNSKYPSLIRFWNGEDWDGPELLRLDSGEEIVGSTSNLTGRYPGDFENEVKKISESQTSEFNSQEKNKNILIWVSVALMALVLLIFSQRNHKPVDQFEGIEDYDFAAYSEGYDIGVLFFPYGEGTYSAYEICNQIADGTGIYTNFGSYVFATSTQMNVVATAEGYEGCVDGFNDGD